VIIERTQRRLLFAAFDIRGKAFVHQLGVADLLLRLVIFIRIDETDMTCDLLESRQAVARQYRLAAFIGDDVSRHSLFQNQSFPMWILPRRFLTTLTDLHTRVFGTNRISIQKLPDMLTTCQAEIGNLLNWSERAEDDLIVLVRQLVNKASLGSSDENRRKNTIFDEFHDDLLIRQFLQRRVVIQSSFQRLPNSTFPLTWGTEATG
jgi:hypothetical protein